MRAGAVRSLRDEDSGSPKPQRQRLGYRLGSDSDGGSVETRMARATRSQRTLGRGSDGDPEEIQKRLGRTLGRVSEGVFMEIRFGRDSDNDSAETLERP